MVLMTCIKQVVIGGIYCNLFLSSRFSNTKEGLEIGGWMYLKLKKMPQYDSAITVLTMVAFGTDILSSAQRKTPEQFKMK